MSLLKKITFFATFVSIITVGTFFCSNFVFAVSDIPTITRDLTVGSTGDDVKALQVFLNKNGYTVAKTGAGSLGKETNLFGNATKAALIAFQKANNISASGLLSSQTRELLNNLKKNNSNSSTTNTNTNSSSDSSVIDSLKTEIANLKTALAELKSLYNSLLSKIDSSSTNNNDFGISAIKVIDGADEEGINIGDQIIITFNQIIDPTVISSSLSKSGLVSGISYSKIGGVSISSTGLVTIKGIASFDLGSVKSAGNFTSKIALNSTGKILTITLTGGSDVKINSEDFSNTAQIGGTIKNSSGEKMASDSSIADASGSFGSATDEDEDDEEDFYISRIKVYNENDEDGINEGDEINITFSEVLDPESINDDLEKGSYVNNIDSDETGGIVIDDDGILTITDIASFYVGDVEDEGEFKTKIALASSGKVLVITLVDGDDIDIDDEDFDDAKQISGTVKNEDGNKLTSKDIKTLEGTFGSDSNNSDDDEDADFSIASINVYDGNDSQDGLAENDFIIVRFNRAIDPKSINSSLNKDGSVENIENDETGGVVVSSNGKLTITNIASFNVGDVEKSTSFETKLSLSSTGKILTIFFTDGTQVDLDEENLEEARQIGGTVKDINGNKILSDDVNEPVGTFI
ncbi:MAG: peptidoglycan-binding domain-containing protein [Patescibacteria group bacterium]